MSETSTDPVETSAQGSGRFPFPSTTFATASGIAREKKSSTVKLQQRQQPGRRLTCSIGCGATSSRRRSGWPKRHPTSAPPGGRTGWKARSRSPMGSSTYSCTVCGTASDSPPRREIGRRFEGRGRVSIDLA